MGTSVVREPNRYESLKKSEAESVNDPQAPSPSADQTPKPQAVEAPAPEALSLEEKVEAERAAVAADLANRFERGIINQAERRNLMDRWENETATRIQREDKEASRGTSAGEEAATAHRDESLKEPQDAKDNTATKDNAATSEQDATGGKEVTEAMQARLDRLHAAQANAPPGMDGPVRPTGPGRGGRGP